MVARDIRRWQRDRQQVDGVSPKTINRNLVSLGRFYGWVVKEDLLPVNPTSDVRDINQEKLSPRFLPKEAVDALLRFTRTIKMDGTLKLARISCYPPLWTGLLVTTTPFLWPE